MNNKETRGGCVGVRGPQGLYNGKNPITVEEIHTGAELLYSVCNCDKVTVTFKHKVIANIVAKLCTLDNDTCFLNSEGVEKEITKKLSDVLFKECENEKLYCDCKKRILDYVKSQAVL